MTGKKKGSKENDERTCVDQISGREHDIFHSKDPRTIKLRLGLDLTQLRDEVRRRGRSSEFETDFSACDLELKSIKPDDPDAMARLLEYYENRHQPLQARVVGNL